MKLLILIIALCSASSLYGQTKQPPPMKTKAVLKAEADLRVVTAERDRLAEQRDSWIENLKSEQSTSARLQKENDTLSVNAAYRLGLLVILDKEIRGIPLTAC